MVWTTPVTFTSGQGLNADDLNIYLRNNLLETAASKATQAGGFFVTSDLNQVEERRVHQQLVRYTASTTSTSFTDLSNSFGPQVKVKTGTTALIIVCAQLWNNTAGGTTLMSHNVISTRSYNETGTNELPAADTLSLLLEPASAGQALSGSYWVMREDLTPGDNTFTAKYRVVAGTGSFMRRRIMVIPL